ncbi:MAG: type II toxin-antitoxin system VapC family toxin [bacterium]
MILVDTDVMIDLLREYPPAVAWLDSLGEEEIILPGFVVMELIQGCRNKTEQEKVEKELRTYSVVWPSSKICDEALFALVRYHLSHRLGILDALIGQMAVALNLPLYTFNQRHYAAIPKLKTVQPYKKNP